jgi:hypothetical protein
MILAQNGHRETIPEVDFDILSRNQRQPGYHGVRDSSGKVPFEVNKSTSQGYLRSYQVWRCNSVLTTERLEIHNE